MVEALGIMEACMVEHRFEPGLTIQCMSERVVYPVASMSYDRDANYPFDYAGLVRLKGSKATSKPAFKAFRRTTLRLEGCHSKRRRADRCAS